MSVLVVGSIALDTIETPFGSVDDALGGSASYFSLAASLFTDVRLVGVVGADFPAEHVSMLEAHKIDTAGLQYLDGRTFRWTGAYQGAMNEAETLAVELNVFAEFDPRVPEVFLDSEAVFLANGLPSVQRAVREQLPGAALVVADTMNYYIENTPDELRELLGIVDGVVLNDGEARMLTGRDVLVDAGAEILDFGCAFVIIKKGEHGSLLCSRDGCIALPAFPTGEVKDPTGAGDSFAGGFMGALAGCSVTLDSLKRAIACGTVVASLTVEGFGVSRIASATREEVDERLGDFREMLAL